MCTNKINQGQDYTLKRCKEKREFCVPPTDIKEYERSFEEAARDVDGAQKKKESSDNKA